jgi:hypothetical protein
MPEICRFLGIIITMYYGDHSPPHFHVRYNQHVALVDIHQLRVLEGKLPPRVMGLVMEWAVLNQTALMANWQLAALYQPIESIAPLE